jgi:hypothetical protein
MRWEIRLSIYFGVLLLIIFLGIFEVGKLQPIPTPNSLQLGGLGLAIVLILDMLFIIWRLKSPHGISNVGYHTMSEGLDIHHFPWHSDIVKDDDKKKLGNLTYWWNGGWNYAGINLPGNEEIWIFPERFEGRIGKCPICFAWLYKTPFKNLPPNVRWTLVKEFSNRIDLNNLNKLKICFGTTGMLDGSDTPDNQRIEFEMKEKYGDLTDCENRLEKLRAEMRKDKELKKKDVFTVKEIKKAEED